MNKRKATDDYSHFLSSTHWQIVNHFQCISLNLATEYLARLATSFYVLTFFALVLTHGFYRCLPISLIVKNHVKTVKVSSKAKKGKKTE
jgi:hypothetical protein